MNGGTWWAAVHGVAKSWTQLNDFPFTFHFHALEKEMATHSSTGVGCHFLLQCMKVKSEREVVQSCPTLSDPMDCSLPGSSVHGIFQAKVLEWGAIAFSRHILIFINYSTSTD